MERRRATNEEIINHAANRRVRFRHFVREFCHPTSHNGVAHRSISHSKVRIIEGVPHVMYKKTLEPVTATHFTLDTGQTFIGLVRLDSPYLAD